MTFYLTYTLCLKKLPTIKLSVTLSNINRFSKCLQCWKAYEIYSKQTVRHYPTHLRHVDILTFTFTFTVGAGAVKLPSAEAVLSSAQCASPVRPKVKVSS